MKDSFGFINAIGNKTKQATIKATFTTGQQANYSRYMADMLKTDPAIVEIMDNETGEILYYKGGR